MLLPKIRGFSMAYYVLKFIHIVSACLLLGSTVMGVVMAWGYRKLAEAMQPPLLRGLLGMQTAFGLQALLVTPISAMAIIQVQHYDPKTFWVIGSALGFLVMSVLWLASLMQLYRCTLPADADNRATLLQAARTQLKLLAVNLPVFGFLIYLMSNRPQ